MPRSSPPPDGAAIAGFFLCLAIHAAAAPVHISGNPADIPGGGLTVTAGDRKILTYQAGPAPLPRPDIGPGFARGGYISALWTPSGRLVTDDFPADHPHHHGVWTAWTKTEYEGRHPDFWNMGQNTGRVEFVAIDSTWQKDGKAGFQVLHRSVDLTATPPTAVLLETWDVTASAHGDRHVVDLVSTQRCAGDSPLKLPEHRYGGLGFRGNAAWKGAPNCRFLSSTGLTDRAKIDTSREKWCWIGGEINGQTCGVTVLCHPENFRFPQPVRANPDQPFFCFAPTQAGAMEIVPGKAHVSRYRFVIADGPPDAKAADGWWDEYAAGR